MIALFIVTLFAAAAAIVAWRKTRGDAPIPRAMVVLLAVVAVLAGLGVIFTARSH